MRHHPPRKPVPTGPGRSMILSVHKLRRRARAAERDVQAYLDKCVEGQPRPPRGMTVEGRPDPVENLPSWARGVRVERAGLFQHAVVATKHRGH